MLDTLRQNSRSALIYVFFGIIILVFVFSFGPGSSGCRSGSLNTGGTIAATVNGKTIPTSVFEQSYARTYRQYQQRAGGAFTDELARTLKLREQVLDQLISSELLAQAAQKEGIVVSDTELADFIKKMPGFQKDGHFDHELYQLMVERQMGTTPGAFEDDVRRELLARKLLASLTDSAKVSDDEVKADYVKEKDKLDLGYVRFNPASFRLEVAKPTDAQIDAFLKESAARVEDSYKQNSARYNKPMRVHARHILAKVDENAPAAEVEAAKKKAEDALAKVNTAGTDFAAVAQQMSEDPGSKDKGGDLGVFGPGTMDPAFQKAAFALKAGEISPVIRTKFGFHVIKVESVLPEEKKALKDVERELASELIVDDGAKALAKKKADEAVAQAREGKKLAELFPATKKEEGAIVIPVDQKPEFETTGAFSPGGEYIPKIGVDKDLTRAALGLTEQAPAADKAFEINGSYFAVVLQSREHADLKELESKMAEYRDTARQHKANELVEAYIANLKANAAIDKNPALLEGGRAGRAVVEDS